MKEIGSFFFDVDTSGENQRQSKRKEGSLFTRPIEGFFYHFKGPSEAEKEFPSIFKQNLTFLIMKNSLLFLLML